jgi:3-deoxy-manno-octulosonate cytidylyltransferase (CMP-KDO synthetase)
MECEGVPVVMWVYNRVVASEAFDEVWVATDDERIAEVVNDHGGAAMMTAADHQSGTDRVYEVVRKRECASVVNVQGDEPLVPPLLLKKMAEAVRMVDDNTLLTAVTYATITEWKEPNVVKAVVDNDNNALYFSRSPIPYGRDAVPEKIVKHIGIYGFTRGGIERFCGFAPGKLEQYEQLEQLRALEYGMKIRAMQCDYQPIGIDTTEDLERFRALMKGSRTQNGRSRDEL